MQVLKEKGKAFEPLGVNSVARGGDAGPGQQGPREFRLEKA